MFGSLRSLTTLDLTCSKLTDISVLGELGNLTRLDLRNNRLKNIGLEFFDRDWEIYWWVNHGRDSLTLSGNPLEVPPVEIVKKGKPETSVQSNGSAEEFSEHCHRV